MNGSDGLSLCCPKILVQCYLETIEDHISNHLLKGMPCDDLEGLAASLPQSALWWATQCSQSEQNEQCSNITISEWRWTEWIDWDSNKKPGERKSSKLRKPASLLCFHAGGWFMRTPSAPTVKSTGFARVAVSCRPRFLICRLVKGQKVHHVFSAICFKKWQKVDQVWVRQCNTHPHKTKARSQNHSSTSAFVQRGSKDFDFACPTNLKLQDVASLLTNSFGYVWLDWPSSF